MFYNFPVNYIEPVFRPPSEGKSFLLQVTIGCSNNRCTYCNMYRSKSYSERTKEEISSDIKKASAYFQKVGYLPEKAFLCDGDALGASFELLCFTLDEIKREMPFIKKVGVYATAQNMIEKTYEELVTLRQKGLGIAYLGMESGCDKVLHLIVKGNNQEEMITGSQKLMDSGIELSVICMLGVGGEKFTESHIAETAKALSLISPQYLSFLTTMAVDGTPYARMVKQGFKMLTTKKLLFEMKEILRLARFNKNVLFRTNHVSNMYPVGGTLPHDQNAIVDQVEKWYTSTPEGTYPPKPSHM
ncbi:radical SAM protein [Bacteriovorax sp. Seq25_V]|uniref:radical SAM protein n=1 Tax=Bacteriovorax sp. Seq25_V TaxID=1201288 RepID=UPI000389F6EF|nr:radical SAM protein [Bacteriovorax sp. Seq25_V]EQC45566.1 radical SAM domain protein [Bacteriovorax sp. Seq25_V]